MMLLASKSAELFILFILFSGLYIDRKVNDGDWSFLCLGGGDGRALEQTDPVPVTIGGSGLWSQETASTVLL